MGRFYDDQDWDIDGFPGEYVYGDSIYVDDYYMDERWLRDVDYPMYWVSNKGRVWSSLSQGFINGSPTGKCGHIDVSLKVNGRRAHKYLHRMVAEAFIPNPHRLPIVRHLDDDPFNNNVENLRWGTTLDNVRDCIDNGNFRYLTPEDRELAMMKRREPVVAANLLTGRKQAFKSQRDAAAVLGISQASISDVVRGISTNACGYYFYQPDDGLRIDLDGYRYVRHLAPIRATHIATGKEYYFRGQTEAAKQLGMSIASVCNVINGKTYAAKGYRFEYLDEEEFSDAY